MPIITYVDDHYNERYWKIDPPIAVFRTTDEYLSMPLTGDVLIIHGGQKDGRAPVASSGRPRIVEAIVRVCNGGGRAIIFSGGHSMVVPDLRASLSRESLEEGLHYLLLTAIQNIHEEIDLDRLQRTPPAPGWPIREIKRRHAAPTLLTLALLCQAALLTYDPADIRDDTAVLLGGRDAMSAIRSGSMSSASLLLTPQPWRSALRADDPSAVFDAVNREWPAGGRPYKALRDLINALFTNMASIDTTVLSDAFAEIHAALQLNAELQH